MNAARGVVADAEDRGETRAFAEAWRIPLDDDGWIPDGAAPRLAHVVRVARGVAADAEAARITAIRATHLGRFSNGLAQLANMLQLADVLGAGQILLPANARTRELIPTGHIKVAGSRPLTVRLGDPDPTEVTLEGRFFYSTRAGLAPLFAGAAARWLTLRRIRHGLELPIDASPFDRDELVIHLRSGDVFTARQVHPGYGQPPLAFYRRIIEREAPRRVHLVFECRANPVVDALEDWLAATGRKVQTWSGSLREDLSVLLRARKLVAGFGTFMAGVLALSEHVETVYSMNRPAYSFQREGIRKRVLRDRCGGYTSALLTRNWENSSVQREMMVSYPQRCLRLESGMETWLRRTIRRGRRKDLFGRPG